MMIARCGVVFAVLLGGAVPGVGSEQVMFPGAEWAKRSPESLGLDAGMVARLGARMKEARANGALIYKGYLVAEWTFDGPSTQRFEVQSVTKSITSLALGLAVQERLIPGLDAKVKDHYPALDAGPYSGEITFRHLATCTSGIKAKTSASLYNAREDVKPGVESRYHNEHTIELARALTYVFGDDLETVLRSRVLQKINADTKWDKIGTVRLTDGREAPVVYGSHRSHWTAQDLARVGWLYANGGRWNGTQILSAEYVAESMTAIPHPVREYRSEARYRATNTDGLPYDPMRERPGLRYGLCWWSSRHLAAGREMWRWNMGGNYGQACMVWPEAGLVLTKVNTPRQPPFIGAVQLWPAVLQGLPRAP